MKLSPNFTLEELTVTNQRVRNEANEEEIKHLKALAVNILQPLRDAIGKPIHINSAFRSESVNRLVGGSPTSQHRLGQAADIRVDGMTSKQIAKKIIELKLPYDQVIEEFGRWVHVSYSYRNRRQQLTAVSDNGRTIYKQGIK